MAQAVSRLRLLHTAVGRVHAGPEQSAPVDSRCCTVDDEGTTRASGRTDFTAAAAHGGGDAYRVGDGVRKSSTATFYRRYVCDASTARSDRAGGSTEVGLRHRDKGVAPELSPQLDLLALLRQHAQRIPQLPRRLAGYVRQQLPELGQAARLQVR